MLLPKKVKYRKQQRGDQIKGRATRKTELNFGGFGLKATTAGWLTSRQLEAARRAITGHLQRRGKVWIRVFPDKSVSVKGNEIRMGGGKGAVDHYVAPVKPGTILFEIDGVPEALAASALRLAKHKLPVATIFITKQ